MTSTPKHACDVCHKKFPPHNLFPITLIRFSLLESMREDYPELPEDGHICPNDLAHYKEKHRLSLAKAHQDSLSEAHQHYKDKLSQATLNKGKRPKLFVKTSAGEESEHMTFGQRLSDRLAYWGGSWAFICSFGVGLFLWMALNSYILYQSAFDPYPYIFLNFILSCMAAIQAPIIMMSQNRQEERDRIQSIHDYQINLRAELEIRQLTAKIDHFVVSHWFHGLEFEKKHQELMSKLDEKGVRTVKIKRP